MCNTCSLPLSSYNFASLRRNLRSLRRISGEQFACTSRVGCGKLPAQSFDWLDQFSKLAMHEIQAVPQSYEAPAVSRTLSRRVSGQNIWLSYRAADRQHLPQPANQIKPEILEAEEAIRRAQLDELKQVAGAKEGDIAMILSSCLLRGAGQRSGMQSRPSSNFLLTRPHSNGCRVTLIYQRVA